MTLSITTTSFLASFFLCVSIVFFTIAIINLVRMLRKHYRKKQ